MATAPSKPTLSITPNAYNLGVKYGVTSFGDPNSGTLSLYQLPISSQDRPLETQTAVGEYTYRVNMGSAAWANTRSSYRVKADNGSLSTWSDEVTAVTLPPDFSISGNRIVASNVTSTSFDVEWYAVALGTEYQVDLYASLDDGQNWTLVAQDISNATSYTHTFSNLTPGDTYRVLTQARDSAGRTNDAVSWRRPVVTTIAPDPAQHSLIYGPLEGEVTIGVTGTIRSGGAGNVTAFDGDTFWNKVKDTVPSGIVSYLRVISPAGSDGTWYLYLAYSDGTPTQTIARGIEREELPDYGITATLQESDISDYIDLTPILGPSGMYSAKRITGFYGSVNGETKITNKVYGPAEGTIYVADWDDTYLTSFDSNAFFSKLEQTYPGEIPLGIGLNKGYISQIGVTVYSLNLTTDQTQGGTPHLIDNGETTSVVDTARQWGFNPNSAFSSSESALAIVRFSAESGSVSKLIYQGFGHAEYYRYGRVVYYTDSSHTTTRTIGLESQSDIDGLCAQSVFYTTWDASVQGISIPNTNIKEVYLTSLVNSIPSNFLYYCTSLDNLDFSQTTITTTNPYFVNGCSSLNVPITIPQTLTTILGTFFSNNTSFNQPITLPSGLVSIGYNFFTGNNSMTSPINVGSLSESIILEDTSSSHSFNVSSSSTAYTNGIPIAGSNRAAWIARFPNLSGTWYRKLIDAGY